MRKPWGYCRGCGNFAPVEKDRCKPCSKKTEKAFICAICGKKTERSLLCGKKACDKAAGEKMFGETSG